jgi:hypothetical protein
MPTPTAPGKYFYTDTAPDATPQGVHVELVNGELCALFPDVDQPGGWVVLAIADMAGNFAPA